jgi:hypothetical protein
MLNKLKKNFFSLFFCATFVLSSCAEKKVSLDAEAESVTGKAYIFKQGAAEWKELEPSSPVDFGDSLKTGKESQVEVAFGRGNTIKIDENSKIFLSHIADSSDSNRIEVFNCNGSVLSNIEKLPKAYSLFQVRTPMSVAKISGTFFIVTYNARRRTSHVNVLVGNVWVINPRAARGFVVVHPGFFTVISWGRPPGKPVKLNYGQWKKYHRLMGPRSYKRYGKKFKIKYSGKPGPFKKGAKFKKRKFMHKAKGPQKKSVKFKGPKPVHKSKGGYKIKPKGPQKKAVKGKAGGGKGKSGKRK